MTLTLRALNKKVINAQYAVRGALALRAEELRAEIKQNPGKYPFEIVNANIGNPQQLDQKPVTFFRQVLAMVQCPSLIDTPPPGFKPDAVKRAKTLLDNIGSVGAYTMSNGVPIIRESVANYISKRDGFPARAEDIYLLAGASSGVAYIIQLLATEDASILIPIPQYPLYSASLTLNGVDAVGYYLDESQDWGTNVNEISSLFKEISQRGKTAKMIVVVNPGNPTGSILSREEIAQILKTGYENDVIVLADEVYQANIFNGEFHSFKKIRQELIAEDKKYEGIQLISVHSTSKGYIGECGQRGGYMEVLGLKQEVLDQLYKLASIALCPVVSGQVLTELMVNPPKQGDESYSLFAEEEKHIKSTLEFRANKFYELFKGMEGVTCNKPQGAMYLMPKITLPPGAIKAAEKAGQAADEFYCMAMLNATGVCVVPGSGFGQEEGTFHFRTTFLAPMSERDEQQLRDFHHDFMQKYA